MAVAASGDAHVARAKRRRPLMDPTPTGRGVETARKTATAERQRSDGERKRRRRGYHPAMRFPRPLLLFLALSWAFVVLYPDPTVLVRSVRNLVDPRVDPAAVAAIAARLPDDPRLIEAYVLETQVPYALDWQTAGVPWYFPSTRDVLAAGAGDCEARAIVLHSILTAKGIRHAFRVSFGHIWVDYPGKTATALENPDVVVAGTKDGRFFIHWPKDFHLGQEIDDQIALHWTPAPLYRVILLFGGVLFVLLWNAAAARLSGAGLAPTSWPPPAPAPRGRRFAAGPHRV
jgi:hypothetical protein